MNQIIRCRELFKMEVVRERERQGLNAHPVRQKYGIVGGGTVEHWARKYGNGLMGKVIRVATANDVDERKRLRERIQRLESLLADTHLELALERQYTRPACERARI